MLTGGRRITEEPFNHGYFVEPTIIDGLSKDHPFFKQELFVPITVVGDVLTLEEALQHANDVQYGLTAGIFTQDDREIQEFFDSIQAGVVYANRRAGATTRRSASRSTTRRASSAICRLSSSRKSCPRWLAYSLCLWSRSWRDSFRPSSRDRP